jgi:membrane protein insertase Oxa1/YidC/SpoIIIJ
MHYLKVAMGVLLGVVVFLFLDYALPSKNTVRITNTYNRLTSVTASNAIFYASDNTGTVENAAGQRDVRFIETVRPNGKVFVYRNEDTGWIWPPYFKYDSANLQAEATNLQSGRDNPQWVSVTAYGWRMAFLSTYPNAVSIDTLAGPDERPRNWAASIVCIVLLLLLALIWRMWAQFQERGFGGWRRKP